MAKSASQKKKLLVLVRMLWEESDEEHPLSTRQLIAGLERQGIQAERKSIYDDMDTLEALGLDVLSRKGKAGGWYLGRRTFELAELKLLVDVVQSSKFITRRKSAALIHKLESQTSVYQARQLQRQVYVSNRPKAMNENIYYTVDQLHAAINAQRPVSFYYFEYNVKKERVLRRNGNRYVVSPYGLVWDNENYYLAGFDHAKKEMRHYRVDKMADLRIAPSPCQREGSVEHFDIASYAQKHFGMFSGREGRGLLRCRRSLVGVILDRFGQETMLVPDGEEYFTVAITAVVSPQFLGWLFGLGGEVELCGPDWAVELLRNQLRQVEKLYQKEKIYDGQSNNPGQ